MQQVHSLLSMGVRWIAALLLVVLGVQPLPLVGAQTIDESLLSGQQLFRRGDFSGAQSAFADVGGPKGLLWQARAAVAERDWDTAEAVLQDLLLMYPTSDQVGNAYLVLAQVRKTSGDCEGAIRALAAFEASGFGLGPYPTLGRAQCLGRLGDWPGELAAARAGLAIDGPRLTKIELLERAAEASLKMGRKEDALGFYEQSLRLAGTRAYRAEMLFSTATVAHALGQDSLAVDRFRAVVVDYPETARAPGALDQLGDMGLGGSVSPLQAGLALLNGRRYQEAAALLDSVTGPDAGQAQLNLATALVRSGREGDARLELAALADRDPAVAGKALLQLGQLQERAGEFEKADATYGRMVILAPERAAEALFRQGFARYVQQDVSGAAVAWDAALGAAGLTDAVKSQVLMWRSKTLTAGSDAWRDALSQSMVLAPESYAGLRAQELLVGDGLAAAAVPADEASEKAAWLASLGTSNDRVLADVGASPGLRRAAALLDVGMTTEATWEIDSVAQSYVDAKDVAHLSGVADWLLQRDLPQLVLRTGKQERDLVGLAALPRSVQKQVYPAGWGDLVQEQAQRFGVDPLLMLALMRQESSFDPRAQSGADAMGLTQVVPSTARSIAARLGHDDFAVNDLFKPAVSLEYGTWFMSTLLDEFHGRPFLALAAYNAGGGSVERWVNRFGDDPDVLVELVPFAETQTYLRIVYDNYRHYVQLYAPSPR